MYARTQENSRGPLQKKFVAYYRVSTDKQGERGLGMEAQASAVEAFVRSHDGRILAEFREVESGKRDDRPELAKALARCRVLGATLLIAKLDRLSRDTLFLLTLQKAGADFAATDMPDANKMTVTIMAAMAEHEREAISTRTREALAVARQRVARVGQKNHPHIKRLGNPNGAAALQRDPARLKLGHAAASAAVKAKAIAFACDLMPIIAELRAEGILSANAQAAALNARQIPTARGGKWTARTVINGREKRVMSEDEKISLEFVSRQLDHVLGEMRRYSAKP